MDVSPTIHVHRNYYNGDKEFQGPIISGGPTVVVANHPRTGKRLYIDVNLPSGAPLIEYDEDSITYVYNERRVVLRFGRDDGEEQVTIVHLPGRGCVRKTREHFRNSAERRRKSETQSALSHTVRDAAGSVKRTVTGVVGVAATTAQGAADRIRQTFDNLPGIQQVQAASQSGAERAQGEATRFAGETKAKLEARQDKPTIR